MNWTYIVSTFAGILIGIYYAKISDLHKRIERLESKVSAIHFIATQGHEEKFPEEIER